MSVTDLKGTQHIISDEGVSALNQIGKMTVSEYLHEKHGGRIRIPIKVSPDDTLSIAVDNMVLNQIHRVWVVDNNSHGVGVVSLTDVIKIAFNEELKDI